MDAEERLAVLEGSRRRRRANPVQASTDVSMLSTTLSTIRSQHRYCEYSLPVCLSASQVTLSEDEDPSASGWSVGQLWTQILAWANKAAFASIFVLIGGWILFRFVGPLTGLYSLTNDLSANTP